MSAVFQFTAASVWDCIAAGVQRPLESSARRFFLGTSSLLRCLSSPGFPTLGGLGDGSRRNDMSLPAQSLVAFLVALARSYICAPIIQGTVSSLPTPSCSLLDFSPDATASRRSKISRPFSSTVESPSMMSPQLMSMSSCMRLNMRVLVASLIDGAGLEPKQDPRPVVNATRLAPLAICPVAPMGS